MIKLQSIHTHCCRMKMIHDRTSLMGFVFVGLAIIFFSCSNKSDHPVGILSMDQMTAAMTEFYVRESKINSLRVSQDSALKLFQVYLEQYADTKNIPDTLLEISYQYYLGKPDELNQIYDRIIDSLVLKEQRAGAIPKRPE